MVTRAADEIVACAECGADVLVTVEPRERAEGYRYPRTVTVEASCDCPLDEEEIARRAP